MIDKPPLHVVFTLDCDSLALKANAREQPKSWTQSARAIEGYCTRLLAAGFPVTLFLAHEAAHEHMPLLDELSGRGCELALFVNPPVMEGGRFKRELGEFSTEDQRLILDYAAERFADTTGVRPRSIRIARFSASDATFKTLYDLGFRQGSISRPGWEIPRFAMRWANSYAFARYVNSDDRLRPGELPFFELPLTTDPAQRHVDGMPYELAVDAGSLDALLRPTLHAHLARLDANAPPFHALCITSGNRFDYYDNQNPHSHTLEALIDELLALKNKYEIVPLTLNGAHQRFRMHTLSVEG
jgi:hypothetical protein